MSTSIFCTASANQADTIIRNLKAAGFSNNDISVVTADKTATREFADRHDTNAPEGAMAGAGTGLLLGGTLGWLAGIGTLAIPGLGAFIAAGPIMAALSGAAVGGTVGGITGALIGMGVSENDAARFEEAVKSGDYLISVHSEDYEELNRARHVIEQAGGRDVTVSGEVVTGNSRY
ncbi:MULTISPECIES: hypothetical protein [unclassified Schlesneria]|uniref:hypothetical protein n=1 Tax=Schlesneria TaxID=656899 RepID=UPI002EF15A68